MIGKKSNSSLLPPAQEKKNQQKVVTFKLLICILITNIFVFLASQPSRSKSSNPIEKKIFHPEHTLMRLNLKLYLSMEDLKKMEIPVTLYNQKKQMVLEKAFLHLSEKSQKSRLRNDDFGENYDLEIPQDKITKIITLRDEVLLAYPFSTQNFAKQKSLSRGPHEIVF